MKHFLSSSLRLERVARVLCRTRAYVAVRPAHTRLAPRGHAALQNLDVPSLHQPVFEQHRRETETTTCFDRLRTRPLHIAPKQRPSQHDAPSPPPKRLQHPRLPDTELECPIPQRPRHRASPNSQPESASSTNHQYRQMLNLHRLMH